MTAPEKIEIDEQHAVDISREIDQTGLYNAVAQKEFQIWEVEDDQKKMVGFSSHSLEINSATALYQEYLVVVHNEIKSVYDVADKLYVH